MIPILASLQFINIQSHKDTLIHLVPGLNVIKGTSHKGKSAMMRGIRWWLKNDPLSPHTKIKNWDATDDDEMSVIGEFSDGSYVIRTHSPDFNGYLVGDSEGNEEPYEALRGEVPEEVRKALWMEDVNFRGQGDGYFMFDKGSYSPGEVARLFNKCVGLDIIDKVLSNINSMDRAAGDSLKANKKSLEKEKAEAKRIGFVRELESRMTFLERKVNRCQTLSENIALLKSVIGEVTVLEREKEEAQKKISFKQSLNIVKIKVEKFEKVRQQHEELNRVYRSILITEKTIEDLKDWLTVKPKAEALKAKVKKLEETSENYRKINSAYTSILQHEKVCSSLSLHLEQLKNKRTALTKKLYYCQYCGAHKRYWKNSD